MPDRDYYFFFNKDGMPIAVFLTHDKSEAFELFAKLYRRRWSASIKLGITMEREKDVSEERWIEIHRKHYSKPPKLVVAEIVKPKTPVMKLSEFKRDDYSQIGLETAKYMTRM